MNEVEKPDYATLRWVKEGLDETIQLARQALEAYEEAGFRGSDIATFQQQIHQLLGTLRMVQVYGGAMLVEEMERVGRLLAEGALAGDERLAESLMLGLVQLPAYLQRLEKGEPDIPLVLLPVLNDLRAARGAVAASEIVLYAPNLNRVVEREPVIPGSGNERIPGLVREQRTRYHHGLLGWYRNQGQEAGLDLVLDVIRRVNAIAGTRRLRRLMDSAEALVLTLMEGEFTADDEVKQLFSRLDRVFKELIEKGEEEAMEDYPIELLKSILYFVSRSHSHDPVVQSVKRTADLANSFPDQLLKAPAEVRMGADEEVLATVFSELGNDLAQVQENLDLYIRGDREELHRLQGLGEKLSKVADTLGMLGRGVLREKLAQVADRLKGMESGQIQPTDEQLMEIATAIVEAETVLSRPGGGAAGEGTTAAEEESEKHDEVVIREAFSEFSRIKEGLERYLHDTSESGRLQEVAADVHKLAGVFSVIDLDSVAGLLREAEPELQRLGEEELELSPHQRGALVDFFAALDYYLEARLDGRSNLEGILAQARNSLRNLHAGPGALEEVVHPEFMEQPAQPAPVDEISEKEVAEEEAGEPEPAMENLEEASAEPVSGEEEASPPMEQVLEELEIPSRESGFVQGVTAESPSPEEEAGQEEEAREETEAEPEVAAEALSMDEIDPEIFEIFMEEAGEELGVIEEQYPLWRADTSNETALQTFRRSFHTLKGSGRMVGAHVIGEFAWSVENLLNRIMDGTVAPDGEVLEHLDQVITALPQLIEAQKTGVAPQVDVATLRERGFALAEARKSEAEPEEAEEPLTEVVEEADSGFVGEVEEQPAPAIALPEDLYSIFRVESENHLVVLQEFLERCEENCVITPETVRAVHTLRGSSHLAEVEPMAVLAGEMEIYCNHLHQLSHACSREELGLLKEFHATMVAILDAINVPGSSLPDWQALVDAIRQADHDLPEVVSDLEPISDSELISEPAAEREIIDLFLEEAAEILEQLDRDLTRWIEEDETGVADALKRGLHTIKGGARMAGFVPLGDLAQGLEGFFEVLQTSGGQVDRDTRNEIRELVEGIEDALDSLHLNGKLPDLTTQIAAAGELAARVEQLVKQKEEAEPQGEVQELESQEPESILLTEKWAEEAHYHPESTTLESSADEGPGEPPSAEKEPQAVASDVDPELLELFLEEAGEITERLEEHLTSWEDDLTSHEAIDGLMRNLHTLKGNARFASLFGIGDLSHALESLFENLADGSLQADERLRPLVRQGVDRLETSIEMLQQNGKLPDLTDLTEALEAAAQGASWELTSMVADSELSAMLESTMSVVHSEMGSEVSSVQQEQGSSFITSSQMLTDSELLGETESAGDGDRIIPFPDAVEVRRRRDRQRPPPLRPEEEQTGKGERVRVLAELLDQLVNNAGEVSIYRARLERHNMRVQQNLEELNSTILRLQSQLRALELETEAQIRSRHERKLEEGGYEDFDPLEMDRYSNLQQLSRGLSETIADLSSIGDSLSEQTRDADTLLLQQARVTNDLQDGLLRSRMVPFKRQASRLQRVVRQTAQSLGKKAELDVIGAEGEIDRTILNRIMGPLEHLLRNAVAHGIEPPEKRLELDKPETGKVSLVLTREGSEVVLNISDDGAGLDAAAIRRKAIQNGLLEESAEVEEEALYQFILQPGFTTAAEVTQVAGRGVGMDAVVSEIKQLGGSLEIMSEHGRGSSFVIRLPFTLAISEALLVKVADDVYAIPHGTTEVIIRVSREDLMACYRGQSEGIEYGGRRYPVRYMGSMLGVAEPVLPENAKWFPLLLVRAGEQRLAIQVDQLLGNHQVVVKSIGAQLAGVRWFTGGTILADGKIALLLDMNALIRSMAVVQAPAQAVPEPEMKGITVMVVDDSITVRKVTRRLLERHNMHVVTAKDGVDAITVLQERKPDVMLLDIEMPRMDGYELARHIRNTSELEDIPIIMITSRTGEKHRQRALELGVDRYLGKPYQETDLLENIYVLLGERIL